MAYTYCEELTRREAGNFYHSFKYLPEDKRQAMCAVYAFCRRADDIADGDWSDRFPGSLGRWTRSQGLPRGARAAPARRDGFGRGGLPEQNHATLLLQEEALSCYNEAWSTDPVFLALKDTVQRFTIPALCSMI